LLLQMRGVVNPSINFVNLIHSHEYYTRITIESDLSTTMLNFCKNLKITNPRFPTSIKDLDHCVKDMIGSGGDGLIDPDHPGFNDANYKKRRSMIAANADA
jgi:hypothetical protein